MDGDREVIFSTEGLPEREQLAAWRDCIGDRFGLGDVSRPRADPARFQARIRTVALGSLAVSDIASDAQTFERTPRHVSLRARDGYTVGLVVEGAGVVEQEGRAAAVGPGSFVLCDGRRPYRVRFDAPFRQIVVDVGRAELLARLPDAPRRTAVAVDAGVGLGPTTAALVGALAEHGRALGDQGPAVADHALDLLGLTLGQLDRPDGALAARVRGFIDGNLGDPALTPATIARRHRISRRYLYRLFDGSGETVAALIRRRRLLRCKAALADPRQARRTIAEIAFAWGFNDAGHFSRAFRAEFGLTPRAFRRLRDG